MSNDNKISITVQFLDGSAQTRDITNYEASDEEFINLLSSSFDIPRGSLSNKDEKSIREAINNITTNSLSSIKISLSVLPGKKQELQFSNLLNMFSYYIKKGKTRNFWINYSTWIDFWDKIETIFIKNKIDKNLEKLVLWDTEQVIIYDLKNSTDKQENWDTGKLMRNLEEWKNSAFILEDFDVVLQSCNNYYIPENVKSHIKNILSSQKLSENNSYLIVAANASEEIEIPSQLKGFWVTYRDSSKDFPILESLGENATAKAKAESKEGNFENILGRENEIKELVSILSQRKYNNVLIVGRAGVGKTAIVKGLAQNIIKDSVPDNLKNVQIFDVKFADIMKDTSVAGSLEKKVTNLLAEVKAHRTEVIVFFDEFHQLMSNSTIRDILKPALANGEFPCIGATTDDEYRQFVAGVDEAFAQRFAKINIDELSIDVIKEILNDIVKANTKEIDNKTLDYLYWSCKKLIPFEALPRSGEKILRKVISESGDNNTINKSNIKESFAVGKISILLSDRGKYSEITSKISSTIKGQEKQINNILRTIRNHFFILTKIEKPLVMLFMGPTGTGKTQLALELAKELWGDENRYLLFNMGSVEQKTSIIGAPPSYVGYNDSTAILSFISANDSGIIILDEFEKIMHKSEILDAFLEIFDKGSTYDNKGKKLNCRPFIFILTSNLGQELSSESSRDDRTNLLINKRLKKEFIGRINLIEVFNKISVEDAKKIIKDLVDEYNNLPDFECKIELDDSAINNILDMANFKTYGARNLKSTFNDHMNMILLDNQQVLDINKTYSISFENDEYILTQAYNQT
jgi:ATP-dependent Clp protease ATP-binding subunit ClpA